MWLKTEPFDAGHDAAGVRRARVADPPTMPDRLIPIRPDTHAQPQVADRHARTTRRRRALEGAAGLCLSRTNYEVDIEHVSRQAARRPNRRICTRIFAHFGIDLSRLTRDLTARASIVQDRQRAHAGVLAAAAEADRRARGCWPRSISARRRCARAICCSRCCSDRSWRRWSSRGRRSWLLVKPEALRDQFAQHRPRLGSRISRQARRGGAPAGGRRRAAGGRPATQALDQFTIDLTARAKQGKIDPVLGRDFEIRQIVDILMRRRQNNPILTGEAGVGKTAVVEGFALRIAEGDVPPPLAERRGAHARPGPAAGRRRRQGRVREPAQVGHRGGQGLAAADHPVHRRSAHDDRRRRPGRAERRRQPAQAGAGARRAAHDRGDDLGRVQEVLREGRGARAAVPGGQGRGADRRPGRR